MDLPEGNEIHRWAARHEAAFGGKPVRVDGPQGRFVDGPVLDGRKLNRVMCVGKHLGYDFGKDRVLHIHLGLQGDFKEGSGPLPDVRGALRLRMWNAVKVKLPAVEGVSPRHRWYSEDDGTATLPAENVAWVELRGPMICEVMDTAAWEKLIGALGPDPLNGDKPDRMLAKVAKSRKPIGALLMEQEVFAGVGNIYRAEMLYRARLNPFTPGNEVDPAVLKKIWKELGPLMKAGMVDRRIVTTLPKDRPHKKGQALPEETHYVYRRHGKPCFVCGTTIEKMENFAGRNLYWCPMCQNAPASNNRLPRGRQVE